MKQTGDTYSSAEGMSLSRELSGHAPQETLKLTFSWRYFLKQIRFGKSQTAKNIKGYKDFFSVFIQRKRN